MDVTSSSNEFSTNEISYNKAEFKSRSEISLLEQVVKCKNLKRQEFVESCKISKVKDDTLSLIPTNQTGTLILYMQKQSCKFFFNQIKQNLIKSFLIINL